MFFLGLTNPALSIRHEGAFLFLKTMKVSINPLGVISLTPETDAEAFSLITLREQGKIKIRFCTKDYDGYESLVFFDKEK